MKPEMPQSTDMQSMSKAERKQIGSEHAVLPMHYLYIGQQAMFQDSTSKYFAQL